MTPEQRTRFTDSKARTIRIISARLAAQQEEATVLCLCDPIEMPVSVSASYATWRSEVVDALTHYVDSGKDPIDTLTTRATGWKADAAGTEDQADAWSWIVAGGLLEMTADELRDVFAGKREALTWEAASA